MSQDLILVVEDEFSQRRLYVEALKLAEYRVLGAETGEEALNLLKMHVPRAVILDVRLPGMSGPEVCQKLRDRFGRSITVIFYTEGARLPVLLECMEAGGDDFLIKGASLSTMLERVGYWLHAASRSLHGEQRESILSTLRSMAPAAEPPSAPPPAPSFGGTWRKLRTVTDEHLGKLTIFVQRARSGAPRGFGRTVQQKLYLLGYIAGAVNFVANSSMALKIRFLDYLKATLHETGVLELEEVDDLVDNWHEFYGQPTFEAACRQAEMDFQDWQTIQKPPRGIVEYAYSAEAEAEGKESV
ncbi:MAG: response regulator [Proteobacteria bacterium]|nr:response regulator [Pseudomonadota bacterium]MBI3496259.1 response regulator [Pseudomonadota bacterium]